MEINIRCRLGGLIAVAVLTGASLVATATGASAQPTAVSPAATVRPFSSGAGDLFNRITGKCATVGNDSLEDNAPVWQMRCFAKPSQEWISDDVGGGFVHLRNLNSNLCLDFARNVNGQTVKQHTCGNDVFQRWKLRSTPRSSFYFTVVSAAGRCLDLDNGGLPEGTKIQVWDCLDNDNQLWA